MSQNAYIAVKGEIAFFYRVLVRSPARFTLKENQSYNRLGLRKYVRKYVTVDQKIFSSVPHTLHKFTF